MYPWEVAMERFIHQQNLELYRKLLADPNDKDEARHQMLLKLLADEVAGSTLNPCCSSLANTSLSKSLSKSLPVRVFDSQYSTNNRAILERRVERRLAAVLTADVVAKQ
jgi:hypothetical protein